MILRVPNQKCLKLGSYYIPLNCFPFFGFGTWPRAHALVSVPNQNQKKRRKIMHQTAKHLRVYFLIIFLHRYSYRNVQENMIREKWKDARRPFI